MVALIFRLTRCDYFSEIGRRVCLFATLAILLVLPALPAQALSRADQNRVAKAVVAVHVYEDGKIVAKGVGVIVGRAGHVLTSAAVLNAGTRATVVAQGSRELATRILLKDDDSGLGVLQVDGLRLPGLQMLIKTVPPQTLIFAAPRPSPSVRATFVRGTVVRNFTWTTDGVRIGFVRHSASIARSAYGSPVVDDCGRIVGLNVPDPSVSTFFTPRRKLKPKVPVSALNVSEIALRLGRLGIRFTGTTGTCIPAETRARAAARAEARRAAEESALAAARAAEEQQRSERMRRLVIWGGSAGAALLFAILLWWTVSARRRRRTMRAAQAQAAEAVQRAAVAQRQLDDLPEPAPFDCVLTGAGEDGAHYALNLRRGVLGDPAGVVVGRNPAGSAYVIADSSVSREHVRLYIEEGVLRVEDLESTNGTRLNGRRLKPGAGARVDDGDELVLGSVSFKIDLEP